MRAVSIPLDTLVYARRLREAGFSEQQAEGQAEALAAAMTDTLATKQDVAELRQIVRELELRFDARFSLVDGRFDHLEKHIDTRLAEQEKRLDTRLAEQEKRLENRFAEQDKRIDIRFSEQAARFGGQMADLERRMTMRLGAVMVAGVSVLSVLTKLL